MQLGFVGLGKMGANMVHRIHRDSDHTCVAFDFNGSGVSALEGCGPSGASSLDHRLSQLEAPRSIWIMVPSGDPTQSTVDQLEQLLEKGDTIIDGGNSRWTDDKRRQDALAPKGIHYVKMVHNGIEYGIMQAYAEGFSLFEASEFELDNAKIAHLWMQGSVIRSWLCELAAAAFDQEGNHLDEIAPWVEDSGEGRWTVEDAIDKRIPMPVISGALFERFSSRGQSAFAAKVDAALRNQFGGHAIKEADPAAQTQAHAE